MNTVTRTSNTLVMLHAARSFPDGIQDAYNEIFEKVGRTPHRVCYGLSRGGPSGIEYFAALEELHEGEALAFGLTQKVIPAGEYHHVRIEDYMQNLSRFGQVFQSMIATGDVDPNGFCIEQYESDKVVHCMLRKRQVD